jgi:predicted nucleotidyltransferase
MDQSANRSMQIKAALPKELLQRVVDHMDPVRVFVFGSRAQGKVHEDSDWDLLVVVDDDIPPERIGWRAVHEARRGIDAAIDLIPFRESNYRKREKIIGSLPWIVASEGVMVYERPTKS